ncbi:hypothetical protein BT96DRAFT_999399 [Gymnopus androsaceus JB14]|uniref:CxC2-like cysteine cluster KDZ transposase-associated domain-containing protein n=1 Tax=Gymnopus androsaceus JB14 TaxID=1447944 RepID=A0A6A4H882_9AGAR|nr:hypothetical protein BT96DRAFT_999399 [Gymnopus androsaceus JB14]
MEVDDEEPSPDFSEETRSKHAKLLADYSKIFPVAAKLLMMKEADVRIGTPCACGNAIREVRCLDCTQFSPLCRSCWVNAHKHHPFHWAKFWSHEQGYFVRQDISVLLDSDYGIPLGHDGEHCPKALKAILMTVVDLNGVHATKITTCQCGDNGRWRQLFDADLFPATVVEPQTAFTFHLLQDWQIMTLQSKITTYHYIRALRRLTDNVFTGNVPDPYKQFIFVTRIWPLLEAKKQFGRLHSDGMNELFPHRPKGNLMLYCPACPEPDVNMESGWERTPHLNSLKRTVDGNFKTRNYDKKNNTNDVSLFGGRAYMPSEQRYQHYLETVLQLQKEKMTCNHLNVANSVNHAKFKNQSSVDMTYGERHALVDLAMELDLEAAIFDKGHEPNCIWSYDNMCGLTPNISQCWHKYHKCFAYQIDKSRWLIPACHIKNHGPGCVPLYCYVYKPCTSHFHAEMVEYGWAVFNGVGPSVLQMNPGHRIDMLVIHYGDWNWRKTVGLARQLVKVLNHAKKQYIEKRNHFISLCELNESRVVAWSAMDRSPHVDPRNKRSVMSVYEHNHEKAPILKALVDRLMSSKDTITVSSGDVKVGAAVSWLQEGLALAQLQACICRIAKTCKANPTTEVRSRCTKLSTRIDKWHKEQTRFMCSIALQLVGQSAEEPKDQCLFLPSDFSASDRQKFHLLGLGNKQVQMLEVALGDIINTLQTTCKTLTAAYEHKIKHARGQDANTRLNQEIHSIEAKWETLIADYMLFRDALHALGALDEVKWRPLMVKDTFRKSTEKRRTPGDSQVTEGNLWNMTRVGFSTSDPKIAGGLLFEHGNVGEDEDEDDEGGDTSEDPIFNINDLKYFV